MRIPVLILTSGDKEILKIGIQSVENMDISLETGITIATSVATLSGAYFYVKNKVDNLTTERKIDLENLKKLEVDLWREIGKQRDWRQEHQQDSNDYRLQMEEKFGKVNVLFAEKDGKLNRILEILENMVKRFERMEERTNL